MSQAIEVVTNTCIPSATAFVFNTLAQQLPVFDYVPSKATNGPVKVDFLSRENSFDAPYLSAVNSSVFEWWWFEAVSPDLKSSLTVIFFGTSGQAFPLSGDTNDEVTTVFITGLLPNGTVFYDSFPASGAVFASRGPLGKSVAAEFLDTGAKFAGFSDLSQYRVQIESETISGELHLLSESPPHYPCSADLHGGQDLQLFPHVGWANALPAAKANLKVEIGDQTINFTNGLGYADTQWSDLPFTSEINSWYWGHAVMGPYTLVWFDGIASNNKEYVSGYLAKDGQVLYSGCTPGILKVRPKGGNATYPPKSGPEHTFKHLQVTLAVGRKVFMAKVYPKTKNIRAPPLYTRWLGTIVGGFEGEKQYHGNTAFEEFTVA